MKSKLSFSTITLIWLITLINLSAAQDYLPYLVDTVAGDSGVGSNDGPRATARFFEPIGTAVDSAGNVYVADMANDTIRKITPAGDVVTIAGAAGRYGNTDGVGTAARFNFPRGIAVDAAGNVYVTEEGNFDVRKIAPDGTVSTVAGQAGSPGSSDGVGTAARFRDPAGIAIDAAGNLYVADVTNHTIRRITPAGEVTTIAGSPGMFGSSDGTGAAARFYYPVGIGVAPSGDIYIADSYNNSIRKLTPAGVVTTFAGTPGSSYSMDGTGSAARFSTPSAIGVDASGTLWVTDDSAMNVRRVTPAAVVTTIAGRANVLGGTDGSGSSATFNRSGGIAVAPDGNIFIGDTFNNSIRKITPAFVVSTYAGVTSAGTTDANGSAARFCYPDGLAVDALGNVFVADSENNSIRRVTPSGAVTTFAGSSGNEGYVDGPATSARFRRPSGLAFDSSGNLFVADSSNNRIGKITPGGSVSTLAGSPVSGSADGTGTAAQFSLPSAIAIDTAGTLYVADTWNHTIRKISPTGVVTTFAGLAGVAGYADGNGSSARFAYPTGVAVDSAHQVYVVERNTFALRKITPDGTVSTLAGQPLTRGINDGTRSAAQFYEPRGVTVGPDDNIYLIDRGSLCIRRISPDGTTKTLAGKPYAYGTANGLADRARFLSSVAITSNSAGRLYIAEDFGNVIRSATPTLQAASMSSRKHDSSSAGSDWDIPLPLIGSPGVECRSGGASGNFEVVFAFDAPVSFTTASVTDGVGSVSSVDASNPSKIHVFLQNVTNAQRITVTLKNVSDGGLTNDVNAEMGVLLGDVTGDGVVNSADIAQTKSQSGQAVSSSNFRADVTVDGTLNSADIALVKSKSGTALP